MHVHVIELVCIQALLLQCTCPRLCARVCSFCHWCLCASSEVRTLAGGLSLESSPPAWPTNTTNN